MAHERSLNSLAWKILFGTLGAGLLVFAIFQQPWIPVEISDPETGVLVAMPIHAAVPESSISLSETRPLSPREKPIEVPLAKSDPEPPEAPPFAQTAELPPTPVVKFPPAERKLGKPTVTYRLPEAFQVPVSNARLSWSFVIPTGVKRDLYLTQAELRPGNRALVERMILSYDLSGQARKHDQKTPEPGFPAADFRPEGTSILAEWSPGTRAPSVPQSPAKRIPAGADLVLTIHYAPSPVEAPDPWSMDLYLAR